MEGAPAPSAERQGGRPARPHNEPEVFVPGKRQTPGSPAGFLHAFSTRVVTEGRALSATLRSPPNVPESITTVRGERASPARGAVSREPARRPQDPTLRGHLWPRTLGSGMAAEGLGAARPKCRVSPETHARSVLSTTENMSVKKQTNTPSGNLHFTLILSLVRMPTTYETRTKVRRQWASCLLPSRRKPAPDPQTLSSQSSFTPTPPGLRSEYKAAIALSVLGERD